MTKTEINIKTGESLFRYTFARNGGERLYWMISSWYWRVRYAVE